MTYLSRPVFTYPFNWAEALQKSFSFDLREMQIGFGPEVYAAKQLHVVRGFEFGTLATCLGDVAWLEDFFNQLYGPLTGFWLPTDQSEMTVKAVVDSTHFDIVAQDLAVTWEDTPAIYLWFTKLGVAPQAAKITAVATIDATTERVTIDAPVEIDATCKVSHILYVRLAGDEEQAEFIAEQFQRRTIRVVELPLEYISWETGERPVFLYHFWVKFPTTTDHWYYTSFAETLTVGGHDYAPQPITHGELRTGLKADTESLQIDSVLFAGNPLAQFVPFTLPFPLQVEILETTLPDLGSPATLFAGTIQSVESKGKRLTANCVSLIDAFERKLPRHVFQTRCNYALFEPATCKLDPTPFHVPATITAIDATDPTIVTVSVASDLATHWFAEGTIDVGTGTTEELRAVKDSTRLDAAHQQLVLTRALFLNTVAATAVLLPGCDHRNTTCQTKFDNYTNFGGHPYMPTNNQIAKVANVNPAGAGKEMTGTRTIYRPFFKTIDRKLALIREARSWLRTPFRDHCAMKGIGADCVGFAHGVYVALGAIEPIKFPAYALDEGAHSAQSKLEKVIIDSGMFAEVYHRDGGTELPPLIHGDLLGFHLGRSVHHCGILLGAPHFIHAIQNYGVIESMITDPTYRRVMVSVWRCMEPLERYNDFSHAHPSPARSVPHPCASVASTSPEDHP